jgi:hypothetical protein
VGNGATVETKVNHRYVGKGEVVAMLLATLLIGLPIFLFGLAVLVQAFPILIKNGQDGEALADATLGAGFVFIGGCWIGVTGWLLLRKRKG